MFDLVGPLTLPPPPQCPVFTRHELGRLADEGTGLVPMAMVPPVIRAPPPFPFAAYLVMVRGE